MRQLVYTMFITDNRASFHFWWKESLLKHQKVSKYYESDGSLNIIEICIYCMVIYMVEGNFFQQKMYHVRIFGFQEIAVGW